MGAAMSSKRRKAYRRSEPESAETKDGGTGPVNGEREVYEIQASSEVPAIAYEQVSTLEIAETSSHWDNNKRVKEARRARVEWLQRQRRECTTEDEFQAVRSQPLWTQLTSTSCASSHAPSGPSPARLLRIREENRLHFQQLVDRHPTSTDGLRLGDEIPSRLYPFYINLGGNMEVGRKIGGGGQANIHELIYSDGSVVDGVVLKVFGSGQLLADIQSTWTRGIISTERKPNFDGKMNQNCCGIYRCTLLHDGRFAFVLQRCWGDLRTAIDLEIVKSKTHNIPPFTRIPVREQLTGIRVRIMFHIAKGMKELHEKGICHRDLKAANCLVLKSPKVYDYDSNRFLVADYESCEGVMGTRFWRAPEIFLALENKERDIDSTQGVWTMEADVYSYAMTCYEVLTGCIPFEDRAANDYDGVIQGERPPWPDHVDPELQELIGRCWDSEPSKRPTFEHISRHLKQTYRGYKFA